MKSEENHVFDGLEFFGNLHLSETRKRNETAGEGFGTASDASSNNSARRLFLYH